MTLRSEHMTINIGPQHPSTHGVFRLRVTFDGEVILEIEPVFGYLHRGTEKLAEERNYVQIITLTDRMDYVASMTNNQAYCLTVEKLLGVEPPPRAKYLRVMTAELQRIASHLIAIGFFLQDLGALGTPLMYCFRERERILDLFENAVRGPYNRELHASRRCLRRYACRLLACPAPLPRRDSGLPGRVGAAPHGE